MDLILYLLIIGLPLLASIFIRITYNKYQKIDNSQKLTGYDVARTYLDNNGLKNVDIVEVRGTLTDHYDPSRKVVRLSTNVFHDSSIASIAVAAHECGHAVQDKNGYFLMKIRSFLVPIVNLCTRLSYIIIVIGLLAQLLDVVYLGIALTGMGLLFQIITLPVEINASRTALQMIKKLNLVDNYDLSGATTMLIAAALTYVASVFSSLLEIFRLLSYAKRR